VRGEVDDYGEEEAEAEEVEEGGIDLARGEDALGSDEAPDYRCREEHFATWACEMLPLKWCADILNRTKRIVQYSNLNETGQGRGYYLSYEHRARRKLHVMSKFEVANETQSL